MCRFYVHTNFQLLWINTRKGGSWIIWQEFCKKLTNCLPKWLYHFAFPPTKCGSLTGSTSPPAFGGVSVQLWVILVGVQCYLILTCISQWHLMRNIFSHVYLPSVLLFWWSFWPFFKLDHLLSYCWVLRVLWVFWITIFYQTGFLQIFPPSLWLVYSLSWQSHS